MLIHFTTGNFLSFKDPVTLSLQAAPISEYKENVFEVNQRKLLKRAVVYGANSSGKSNLLNAIWEMKEFVLESAKRSSTEEIDVVPFALSSETEGQPCHFEVAFLIDGIKYRYGFEVDREAVRYEWLFQARKKVEKPLFYREGDKIETMAGFKEGEGLEKRTRANALFLSVVDQFNGAISRGIIQWFDRLQIISGLSTDYLRLLTFEILENEEVRLRIMKLLKSLDLGFDKFQLVTRPFGLDMLPPDLPPRLARKMLNELEGKKVASIETLKKKYDANGKVIDEVEFNLRRQESAGTNKVFDLIGPIFSIILNQGVLVVDELGAKMHTFLTRAINQLFISEEFNTNNAQLIFATHDTNLLQTGKFRRDQVYFIEKNQFGASDLYSLYEFKDPETGGPIRKEPDFEKLYLKGKLGAVPYFDDILN